MTVKSFSFDGYQLQLSRFNVVIDRTEFDNFWARHLKNSHALNKVIAARLSVT